MKKNLIIIFLLFLSITLVGCNIDNNEDDESGVIRLTFWNPISGPDKAAMESFVEFFNDEHEGKYNVVPTAADGTDHYSNLEFLIPMGNGPDVTLIHSERVESYKRSGLIIPLDPYIETTKIEFNEEDYIEYIFNSMVFDDELYGVPLDVHTTGVYYNKDLLAKHNQAVPTTREELLNVAKLIQNAEIANDVSGLPLSTAWPSEWIYTTALYQNGSTDVDSSGMPGYDGGAGIIALKSLTDIIHVEGLSPKNLNIDQGLFRFEQGKAVFHIDGTWMLNSIMDSGVNFGVFPISGMFAVNGEGEFTNDIYSKSHSFVLPKQTKQVSEKRQEAIMTFINFMGEHSYMWAPAGQIPAHNAARDTDEYRALEYHPGFGEVDNFRVGGKSPYYLEAIGPMHDRLTAALTNSGYNAVTLINAAVDEARRYIAELS